MSLTTTTKKLGKHHKDKKDAEASLKREREKFFSEATKEIAKGVLAQKVVEIPEVGDFIEWVAVYHPGWVLLETDTEAGTLLLEEDPSLLKFVHVNHTDKKIYQRNAIPEAPSLDDEALAEDHPEVWLRITKPAEPEWLDEIRKYHTYIEGLLGVSVNTGVEGYIENLESDLPRELLPFEDLEADDLDIVAQYMVPGKIKLRLEEPRLAKSEELDADYH